MIEIDRNLLNWCESPGKTNLVFSGTAFSAAPPGDGVEESWHCGHHHCRVLVIRGKKYDIYMEGLIGKIEFLIGKVG